MSLINIRFDGSYDTLIGWRRGFEFGKRKFALEASTVVGKLTKTRYLGRWFAYLGIGTVRLHKFYRGDHDRAPHTHPWSFWTFPLSTYVEHRFNKGESLGYHEVKAFRWHYRSALHEHIVLGRGFLVPNPLMEGKADRYQHAMIDPKPFYTIVIGANKTNEWGFYPEPGVFVHHKDFLNEQ